MTAPARRAQADHPVRARAQRHGRLAGAQSPAVIGTHVHAVGDVTVGSDDAQLIDELRRGEAAPTRAHRRERRGVLALPQVGQCGRARLGPSGLGVGLAQVDDEARLHPRNLRVCGRRCCRRLDPVRGHASRVGRPVLPGPPDGGRRDVGWGSLPSSSRGSL